MSIYESIMQGLTEAVEYEQGNKEKARSMKLTIAPVPEITPKEIKDLRKSMKMTQNTFAMVMGVSRKTVEAWEAGTNSPIGVARRMLGMLQIDNSIPTKYNIISD